MEATFSQGRKWIVQDTPHTSEILKEFPLLKILKYVSIKKVAGIMHKQNKSSYNNGKKLEERNLHLL